VTPYSDSWNGGTVWVWAKGVFGLEEVGEGEGDAADCAKAVPANIRIKIKKETILIIGLLILGSQSGNESVHGNG
jgi:hypothetical protein